MFESAFFSITNMLIKEALLNFKTVNMFKYLSEQKLKDCSPDSVNSLDMQSVLTVQNWIMFKKATTGKDGESNTCCKIKHCRYILPCQV